MIYFDEDVARVRRLVSPLKTPMVQQWCARSSWLCRVGSTLRAFSVTGSSKLSSRVPLGDRARHMSEHPLWFFLYFTVSFLEPREVGTMCVQTPRISMTTSNELRRRCTSSHRWSMECYFLPISPCRAACDQDAPPRDHIRGPELCGTVQELSVYHTGTHAFFLDRIGHMTGLYSDLLIMGTLLSWVMRPQPELEEAVLRYDRTLGLDVPGVRHRRLAMHIRRADKHSLNPSKSRARREQRIGDLWRISDQSYITWSRRVASVIGAEHTLFMSDDAGLLFGPKALEAQGSDGFFRHVPAPASCVPSFAAGLSANRLLHLEATGQEQPNVLTGISQCTHY